jgi:2-keto-4-pentenoate hydratase
MAAPELDPRIETGLRRQLEEWRRLLGEGAQRLGWKVGLTDPRVQQKLELPGPVIGFLTSATAIEDGGSHARAARAGRWSSPRWRSS